MATSIAVTFFLLVTAIGPLVSGVPNEYVRTAIDEERGADLSLVHFLLWTRSNSRDEDHYELINGDNASLSNSHYNGAFETYFLLHGYTDNGTKQWILNAKTELLDLKQCNVISVDYALLALGPNYLAAVKNMYDVSNYTASLIDWLVKQAKVSTSMIHITGHSLGAHAAGMTAAYVTTGTIDRVTGLDPAGPQFYNKSNDQRLHKSQANYVDIIHTNGCSLTSGCDGLLEPLGHVDFYPNGGSHMTGCSNDPLTGCSHQSVTSYWTESIQTSMPSQNTFKSWPCTDWDSFAAGTCTDCKEGCLDMGFFVQRGIEGLFYLYTNGDSPYARGDSQMPPGSLIHKAPSYKTFKICDIIPK